MLLAKDKGNGSNFEKLPLPEAGTTQAVCCGVWDLGIQESNYMGELKRAHKIVLAWELDQLIDAPESEFNGKRFMVTKRYTLSLHEKATLRKDLESWRGKPFTAAELEQGFDIEKLYGVNCYIGIKHEADKTDASKVYANVTALLPLVKGAAHLKPERLPTDAPPKWVQALQDKAIPQEPAKVEDDIEPF